LNNLIVDTDVGCSEFEGYIAKISYNFQVMFHYEIDVVAYS